jgi:hypothetical protein
MTQQEALAVNHIARTVTATTPVLHHTHASVPKAGPETIVTKILTNVLREHRIVSNCVPTLMDHTFAPVMMTSVLDWIHIAVSDHHRTYH